jgi:hypothetical protein
MVWGRIPVGVTFSAPVHTNPWATQHLIQWVPGLFRGGGGEGGGGGKQLGCDVNHPPPSSTEVKERVELYLYGYVMKWHHTYCAVSKFSTTVCLLLSITDLFVDTLRDGNVK